MITGEIFDRLMLGAALYFLITVIFWPVQSGIMDGSEVAISQGDKVLHLGLFILCLAVALLSYIIPRLNIAYRRITMLLGFFALISAIYMGIASIPFSREGDLSSQWERATELSAEQNIIVIGFDSVQGAFAADIFKSNPNLVKLFNGFTLFTNASSMFPNTAFSYRGMLEGALPKGYTKAEDINSGDNLFNDMLKLGYHVSVSSYISHGLFSGKIIEDNPNNFSSIPNISENGSVIGQSIALFQLGINRYIPFAVNLRIGLLHKEFGTLSKIEEREAMQSLIDNVHVGSVEKKFMWFFSLQTHAPVRFTREGKFSFDLTPDDSEAEIEDAFIMLSHLFSKLKLLGVYDDSLIIIFSDHGSHLTNDMQDLPKDLRYLLPFLGKYGPRVGLYQILFMVKPRHSDGDLAYSDNAVTLLELRKTLNEFASPGSGQNFFGINFLDITNSAKDRVVPVLQRQKNAIRGDVISTDAWEEGELRLPIAVNYTPEDVSVQLENLGLLKSALENYYKDHGSYPVSEGFDGLYSEWGRSGDDWIRGLVPDYLPALPRDVRHNDNPITQIIYKSNGKDYKLISHSGVGYAEVVKNHTEMLDPRRKEHAYGYWTPGAARW